jgi:hypothetical protein
MAFWKIILFIALWAFLALWGVRLIEPAKEWEMIVWMFIFLTLALGHNFFIVYRQKKQQKAKDILSGKRPIE